MIDMGDNGKQKVVSLKLTIEVARERIRAAAQDSSNVAIGSHAQERMNERDVTLKEVIDVLRKGYIDELPTRTAHNEWQCKVTLKLRGIRAIGVVVIILINQRLFVKTVEWEDIK